MTRREFVKLLHGAETRQRPAREPFTVRRRTRAREIITVFALPFDKSSLIRWMGRGHAVSFLGA
jgi:hypothetical protein